MSALRLSLLLLLLLPGPSAKAQRADSCCRLRTGIRNLTELGRAYRQLRRQAGSDCCDRFSSGLMQAMQQLHDSLPPGTPQRRVSALMGRPAAGTAAAPYETGALRPGERLLVYPWRGGHDYLYFVVKDGLVIRRDWYHAWE